MLNSSRSAARSGKVQSTRNQELQHSQEVRHLPKPLGTLVSFCAAFKVGTAFHAFSLARPGTPGSMMVAVRRLPWSQAPVSPEALAFKRSSERSTTGMNTPQ